MTKVILKFILLTELCYVKLKKGHMKKNMGLTDKIIRLLIVAAIAILYFTGYIQGAVAMVLGIIAVVFVATSVMSYCPLYLIFGISTRKDAKQ